MGIVKRMTLFLALMLCLSLMTACGSTASQDSNAGTASSAGSAGTETAAEAPEIEGLTFESALKLERATGYSVYHYEGGYDLIDIHDQQRFLLVPEDGNAPGGLAEHIIDL